MIEQRTRQKSLARPMFPWQARRSSSLWCFCVAFLLAFAAFVWFDYQPLYSSIKTIIASKYTFCEWSHSTINVVKEISRKVTPGFKIALIFSFSFSSPITFEGQPLGHLGYFSRFTGSHCHSLKAQRKWFYLR